MHFAAVAAQTANKVQDNCGADSAGGQERPEGAAQPGRGDVSKECDGRELENRAQLD